MQQQPQVKKELPTNQAVMEFSSKPENVEFARASVAMFASQLDFTLDQLEDVRLAVSEAVSNAIVHGYQNKSGPIKLEVYLYPESLRVVVADEGEGIADIDWAMQPANTTDHSRMGLGLLFIQEFMDEVDIQSTPGKGTRISMRKTLTPNQEQ